MESYRFDQICVLFDLGERTEDPRPLSGGFIHDMYGLRTTKGHYAVKCLNPQIMRRPDAFANFKNAEDFALLVGRHLSALPAKRIRGEAVQQIADEYFLIFDWVDGNLLSLKEIQPSHCNTIGTYLAGLHQLDAGMVPAVVGTISHEWTTHLIRGQAIDAEWSVALSEITEALKVWNERAVRAEAFLSNAWVMSHRDLDPKNVLWTKNDLVVIDWESAGPIHPVLDVLETALYWSEDETGHLNKQKFQAFFSGYTTKNNLGDAKWSAVIACSYSSKLDWLAYNISRTFSADKTERRIGTEQVKQTILDLKRHTDRMETLKGWLT
ncbi:MULTISPECIES: phosphotransferase [unclassified Exiguobacterium]|uniref:phosphotransferase n=1 Tax=unclassified Exiguobacterium TaxID=2644629 RepID=UPI001BE748A4|nr:MULTISPECIES: phosphotransferase [unclassified Exiguobacterium]